MGEESFSSSPPSSSSSSPEESVMETPAQSLMATPAQSFQDADAGTPLAAVAEAFEELERSLRSDGEEGGDEGLRLAPFGDACSLVSVLFGCLGFAFKFAEMEYVAKERQAITMLITPQWFEFGSRDKVDGSMLTGALRMEVPYVLQSR